MAEGRGDVSRKENRSLGTWGEKLARSKYLSKTRNKRLLKVGCQVELHNKRHRGKDKRRGERWDLVRKKERKSQVMLSEGGEEPTLAFERECGSGQRRHQMLGVRNDGEASEVVSIVHFLRFYRHHTGI